MVEKKKKLAKKAIPPECLLLLISFSEAKIKRLGNLHLKVDDDLLEIDLAETHDLCRSKLGFVKRSLAQEIIKLNHEVNAFRAMMEPLTD